MSENHDDMKALTGQASRLISAISEAIMSSAEVAAERIKLASQVAQIEQRMAAYSVVLDTIQVQKDKLLEQAETAKGARKTLLLRQVEMLEAQEMGVLESIQVPAEVAQRAVQSVKLVEDKTEQASHKRQGRRFVPVNGHANGEAS